MVGKILMLKNNSLLSRNLVACETLGLSAQLRVVFSVTVEAGLLWLLFTFFIVFTSFVRLREGRILLSLIGTSCRGFGKCSLLVSVFIVTLLPPHVLFFDLRSHLLRCVSTLSRIILF